MTKWIKDILYWIGPLVFVFIIFRIVDPSKVKSILIHADPVQLFCSFLIYPIMLFFLGIRWWIICRQFDISLSFFRLFTIYGITWFLSVLPLRGISPVSKVLYMKKYGQSARKTMLSMIIEKLIDFLGLLIVGLFGFYYFPQVILKLKIPDLAMIILLPLCILVALFFRKIRSWIKKRYNHYVSRRLQLAGEHVMDDLSRFRTNISPGSYVQLLTISVGINFLRSIALFFLSKSIGMQISIGFLFACQGFIGLINLIPITIGGLGTRDSILLMTLPHAGASNESIIALGALAFLWTVGTKLSSILFWFFEPLSMKFNGRARQKSLGLENNEKLPD